MNEVSGSPGRSGAAPLLGELLIEKRLLDERELHHALTMQQRLGGSLGTVLLEKGVIAEDKLLEMLGLQMGMPTASVVEMEDLPAEVLSLIPARLAQRYNVLPLRRSDGVLHIATLHPSSLQIVEDEIRSFTSCSLRPFIGIDFRVREAVQHHYGGRENLRLRALARRLAQLASGQARAAAAGPRSPQRPDDASCFTTGIAPRAQPPPPRSTESSASSTEEPSRHADVDRLLRLVDRISSSEPRPSAEASASTSAARERQTRERQTQERIAASIDCLEPSRGGDPFAGLHRPSDERQSFTTEDVSPLHSTDPAERLDEVSTLLQQAELRDDVAAAVLDYCAPFFARRVLFARRRQQIVGWKGGGEWLEHSMLPEVVVPTAEPSVFSRLENDGALHCGPLAPLPAHRALQPLFGTVEPRECLVIPIRLGKRIACYLWADNGSEDVQGTPLAEIQHLAEKAGYALEICLLRNRI